MKMSNFKFIMPIFYLKIWTFYPQVQYKCSIQWAYDTTKVDNKR